MIRATLHSTIRSKLSFRAILHRTLGREPIKRTLLALWADCGSAVFCPEDCGGYQHAEDSEERHKYPEWEKQEQIGPVEHSLMLSQTSETCNGTASSSGRIVIQAHHGPI